MGAVFICYNNQNMNNTPVENPDLQWLFSLTIILTLSKAKTTFFLVFNFLLDCTIYTIKNCHNTVNLYIPLKMSSSLSEAASWSILEANTSNRSSVPGAAPVSGFRLPSEALRGCFIGDVCDISTFDSQVDDLVGAMWDDSPPDA